MFHNPRVLTLHTRVPAMGLTPRSTPGHLVAMEENRISHLVTQPDTLSSCLQRLANRLPATYPERFERVYANATFQVHRLVPAETPFDAPYDDVFRNGDARWCGPSSYGPS
jgi:hypothetical protein